ncbi:VanZ family protein [Psychroflexus aestuariivivens]|uniref:VanZ family protein n=1 Tax=Psychroflexus aestuariivivens TaxID=1795040 RepID=UPI001F01F54B|nr:VanZ family protein [Psychroflexus aestuariivivens]
MAIASICTLLIAYFSLVENGKMPKVDIDDVDKLYHGFAYFVLNGLWLVVLRKFKRKSGYMTFLKISILVIAFGIIIEVLQGTTTTNRSFDYYDILANSIGVILSFLCFMMIHKRSLEI